ncbi:hypothetical protein Airi02_072290 [Actinoallomurus iriomotensis]|jgi:hypothetical protein|uniref:Uncharacterized protein n=2 Tax=Actinoallomurus iriomotensis TaxID=478107 RepID=A0A9W6W2U4_9ACTN|nr:hypothetical protein Airi02_072290 [Actinoallomurus iriomotensis]
MLGRMRRYDALTVFLLLVGGVIVPVAGWVAGAVMLLVSRRWTLRDKLVGLLIWPGGLAVAVGLIAFSPTRTCVYVDDSSGHHGQCTGTTIPGWVGIPLLVLAIAGPLVTAVHLLRRARRARAAQAE